MREKTRERPPPLQSELSCKRVSRFLYSVCAKKGKVCIEKVCCEAMGVERQINKVLMITLEMGALLSSASVAADKVQGHPF